MLPCPSSFFRFVRLILGILAPGAAMADGIRWADSPDRGQLNKGFDDRTVSLTVDTQTNGVTSSSIITTRPAEWIRPLGGESTVGPPHPLSSLTAVIPISSPMLRTTWSSECGATTATTEVTRIPRTARFPRLAIQRPIASPWISGAPASDLEFQINGINALTKPVAFNSNDSLMVEAFLGDSMTGLPGVFEEGTGFTRDGNRLDGDWFNRIGLSNDPPWDIADQHVTSEGSIRLRFDDPVDRVALTLTNTAENPTGTFQTGFDDPDTPDTQEQWQTWAFSVGDLQFTTIPEPHAATFLMIALLALTTRRNRCAG